ncbi:MAG TPA: amidohydrolase family protein [Candidatus Hydrogenedentes bacterium]|jgi:L-fuconolactonase|nr:amidohydrolase family protein [Candidatus Hydrogenedentota bacterium]MDY0033432.1 amidohydrolase family protein [FCB group bacterium]NLT59799.1 amidohydrolase family protein [Candidatus Hydrogenedentota bacterium]HNV23221.1 amidohydrolase family protein [Candidatus Hydrogenedentota bacterium]HNZ16979.1 amidohydrolase family protein [Candidatus Hydrogenedentota bacterium]
MRRRAFLAAAGLGVMGAARAGEPPAAPEERAWPDVAITDTHVHFWDPAHLRYPWLDGSELLNRPYLPEHYTEAARPVTVDRIVFVQAACRTEQAAAEVAWVTGLAQQDARIRGIVADAPLENGDTAAPLLESYARNPLVKGVRRFLREGIADGMLTPGYVRGVELLGRNGLSCDLGVGRGEMPLATGLVKRFPDVQFLLCHIGVPDIRNRQLDPWREELRALAALPNVVCKLSGMATLADPERWTRDDLAPFFAHVFECFGFERTLFASDWPVMLSATTYPRWVETVLWAIRGCSGAEQRLLFRDTAATYYRLGA